MNQQQLYRAQSFRRSQQFLDDHSDVIGAVNSTNARRQLDAAVSRLDTMVVEQGTRSRECRGETNRRWTLEHELRVRHMASIKDFARARLDAVPDFAALTPSTRRLEGERLAQSALALADAAEPYAAEFTEAQFPADFLDQMREVAYAITQSIDERSEKRGQGAGATQGVKAAIREGRAALAALSAVVRRQLRDNEPLLAEWRAAWRVTLKPGRPTTRSSADPVVGTIPAPVQEVKAA
jgi:hypothetical protein